ncbi:hypothetical protein SAMN05443432_102298 [Roseovarius litoreus]|uniref:Uncharacterized protein n=1 Tax=Roseovarius litoreus TaxID=1155722 RepID=A0A1M7CTS7_9RHOB|nr:hypothetical protein [Roseovarius litoreus]SHL70625.1 hypothetical protein SAMN05443432_102298 [Roseovarius litoreus]
MTRWLQAAQRASEARNLPKKPKQPPMPEVNSVYSVNSSRRKADAVSPEELARDLYEERAAIRKFHGGQDRETAERAVWPEDRPPASNTWLDDWPRAADDLHNPDNWK